MKKNRRFGGKWPATPQTGKYSVRGVRENLASPAMGWSGGRPQQNSVLLLLLLLLLLRVWVFSVFVLLFFAFVLLYVMISALFLVMISALFFGGGLEPDFHYTNFFK